MFIRLNGPPLLHYDNILRDVLHRVTKLGIQHGSKNRIVHIPRESYVNAHVSLRSRMASKVLNRKKDAKKLYFNFLNTIE